LLPDLFRLEINAMEKVMDKYEQSKMRVFILKEFSEIAKELFENSSEGMDGRDLAKTLLNSVYYRLESAERDDERLTKAKHAADDIRSRLNSES
jgi:fructose-1,6-bisphosphatase